MIEERRAIGGRGSDRGLGRGAVQEGICAGLYETGDGTVRVARIRLDNGVRVGLRLSPGDAAPDVGAVVRVRGALGTGDEGIGRVRQAVGHR